jgi:uncharacterized membrane protein YhaH (DUF805 family)
MKPAALLIGLFDWRGTLAPRAYRRNLVILVLVDLIARGLGLLQDEALIAWTAGVGAVSLSLGARRYHDMGRSTAWLVWVNLISAGLALVAFQFVPNALNDIPLPDSLGLDAQAQWVVGRLVVPSIVGAVIGNLLQSVWLMRAPSLVGPNPYAAPRAISPLPGRRDDEPADEASAQAIIDRHLAARLSKPVAAPSAMLLRNAPPPNPAGPRAFGRRRAPT